MHFQHNTKVYYVSAATIALGWWYESESEKYYLSGSQRVFIVAMFYILPKKFEVKRNYILE